MADEKFQRFADDLDRASWLEQRENEDAVAQHRSKAAPEQVRDKEGNWETEECIDCGLDIPPKRLELGKVRCVECQSKLEMRRKQFGYFQG